MICLEWTEMKLEVLMVTHINLPISMLMNNCKHCVCVSAFVCVCEPLKFTHPAGQILIWYTKLETPGTHLWNNINVRTCMTLQMHKWYDLLKIAEFYRHIAVTTATGSLVQVEKSHGKNLLHFSGQSLLGRSIVSCARCKMISEVQTWNLKRGRVWGLKTCSWGVWECLKIQQNPCHPSDTFFEVFVFMSVNTISDSGETNGSVIVSWMMSLPSVSPKSLESSSTLFKWLIAMVAVGVF